MQMSDLLIKNEDDYLNALDRIMHLTGAKPGSDMATELSLWNIVVEAYENMYVPSEKESREWAVGEGSLGPKVDLKDVKGLVRNIQRTLNDSGHLLKDFSWEAQTHIKEAPTRFGEMLRYPAGVSHIYLNLFFNPDQKEFEFYMRRDNAR